MMTPSGITKVVSCSAFTTFNSSWCASADSFEHLDLALIWQPSEVEAGAGDLTLKFLLKRKSYCRGNKLATAVTQLFMPDTPGERSYNKRYCFSNLTALGTKGKRILNLYPKYALKIEHIIFLPIIINDYHPACATILGVVEHLSIKSPNR